MHTLMGYTSDYHPLFLRFLRLVLLRIWAVLGTAVLLLVILLVPLGISHRFVIAHLET